MHSLGHPTVLLGAVEGEIRYPPAVLGAWELRAYALPLATIANKYAVSETLELCVYTQTLTVIVDKRAVNEILELCAYGPTANSNSKQIRGVGVSWCRISAP